MTSEQKLLQLIRGSPKERKLASPLLSSLDSAQQGWMTERAWFWINRILMVVVVMMFAGLAWRYQLLRKSYTETPVAVSLPDSSNSELVSAPAQQPSFDDVRSIFSSRNVFQALISETQAQQAESQQAVAAIQIDLNQQYRIVGIALGAQPTVIVENIQNSSTVFLGIGDALDQAVVKEIQQDRVILELNGQKVELKS